MNFKRLDNLTIDTVLHYLPESVQQQVQREGVVIAGGVIRDTVAGLPVKDVDIFCHSEEQAARLAMEASPYVKHTAFAYSVDLGIPVQYVYYKDFKDAEDLISQFDFRACCAGVYFGSDFVGFPGYWHGIAAEGFQADCESKTLRFMSQPKDAGKLTAMGRALSLAQKGWKLPANDAAAILTHFEPKLDINRVADAFRPGYGGRL